LLTTVKIRRSLWRYNIVMELHRGPGRLMAMRFDDEVDRFPIG